VAIVPSLALLDVPEGHVMITGIHGVGSRRIEALTRVSRTKSGEPDPVQAVVIESLREVATRLTKRVTDLSDA
jgi:hypothetical protein